MISRRADISIEMPARFFIYPPWRFISWKKEHFPLLLNNSQTEYIPHICIKQKLYEETILFCLDAVRFPLLPFVQHDGSASL